MRKHKPDKVITFLTLFLMVLGLVVIYAIGPMRANFMNSAYGTNYSSHYFFIHQAISVALAIFAFVVAYKFPYERIRKWAFYIMVAGIVLSLLLFVLKGTSLVSCQLGACRWFNLGPLGGFQPAELLKIGLVLYLAQICAAWKKGELETEGKFWRRFLIVSGLSLFFVVVLQKDLGTGIALISIILAILWMSGVPVGKFALVVGVILVLGVGAVMTSDHRRERVATFISGEDENSYHIDNAMIAIGTGGFAGVGVGNSVQATGYLPESINDSVFAVMGETFGFVGLMLVVICFTVLLMRLLRTVDGLGDLEERLVVVGVFAWVAAHVVVNIAAMTGLIPLTGITLPLLSYGGTSMIFVAAAIGVSLQLSCYTGREVKPEKGERLRSSMTARRRLK